MLSPPDAKRGRPTEHTPEVAAEICQRLAEGETLRSICRDDHMPAESTVRSWAIDDRDGFSAQYTRAREIGYRGMADEILEIADDSVSDFTERSGADGAAIKVVDHEHIQRARLRVDTRKWLLAKALPKVYGEKVALTGGGPEDEPIAVTVTNRDRAKALLKLVAQAKAEKAE